MVINRYRIALIVVAVLAIVYMVYQQKQIDHMKSEMKQVTLVLKGQKELNATVEQRMTELSATKTTVIREVHYAQQKTEQAIGAEELVPPDVAAAWADGIDCLRGSTQSCDRSAAPSDSTARTP